jgi:hypothetical protein
MTNKGSSSQETKGGVFPCQNDMFLKLCQSGGLENEETN